MGERQRDCDERAAGRRLLRSEGARGIAAMGPRVHRCDKDEAALARGAELLGRLRATVKPEEFGRYRTVPKLVRLKPSEYGSASGGSA